MSSVQIPLPNSQTLVSDLDASGSPLGTFSRPWYLFFQAIWKRTGSGPGYAQIRPGDLWLSLDSAAPSSDWLAANGQAVSRTTNSQLFALIGTTYGSGDNNTTFNLPTYALASGITTFIYSPQSTG